MAGPSHSAAQIPPPDSAGKDGLGSWLPNPEQTSGLGPIS